MRPEERGQVVIGRQLDVESLSGRGSEGQKGPGEKEVTVSPVSAVSSSRD